MSSDNKKSVSDHTKHTTAATQRRRDIKQKQVDDQIKALEEQLERQKGLSIRTAEEIHIATEKVKAIYSQLSCVRKKVEEKVADQMKTATAHETPRVLVRLAKGSDTKRELEDYYVEAKVKVDALVEIYNQCVRHLKEVQQEKGFRPFKKKTASVRGSISSSISSMGSRASSPDIDDEKLLGKTRDGNVKESNRLHVPDSNSKASGHVVSTPCTHSRSDSMEHGTPNDHEIVEHGTPNGHEPVDELTEDEVDIGVPNSSIRLGGNIVAGTTGYIDGKLLEETSIGDLNEEEEKISGVGNSIEQRNCFQKESITVAGACIENLKKTEMRINHIQTQEAIATDDGNYMQGERRVSDNRTVEDLRGMEMKINEQNVTANANLNADDGHYVQDDSRSYETSNVENLGAMETKISQQQQVIASTIFSDWTGNCIDANMQEEHTGAADSNIEDLAQKEKPNTQEEFTPTTASTNRDLMAENSLCTETGIENLKEEEPSQQSGTGITVFTDGNMQEESRVSDTRNKDLNEKYKVDTHEKHVSVTIASVGEDIQEKNGVSETIVEDLKEKDQNANSHEESKEISTSIDGNLQLVSRASKTNNKDLEEMEKPSKVEQVSNAYINSTYGNMQEEDRVSETIMGDTLIEKEKSVAQVQVEAPGLNDLKREAFAIKEQEMDWDSSLSQWRKEVDFDKVESPIWGSSFIAKNEDEEINCLRECWYLREHNMTVPEKIPASFEEINRIFLDKQSERQLHGFHAQTMPKFETKLEEMNALDAAEENVLEVASNSKDCLSEIVMLEDLLKKKRGAQNPLNSSFKWPTLEYSNALEDGQRSAPKLKRFTDVHPLKEPTKPVAQQIQAQMSPLDAKDGQLDLYQNANGERHELQEHKEVEEEADMQKYNQERDSEPEDTEEGAEKFLLKTKENTDIVIISNTDEPPDVPNPSSDQGNCEKTRPEIVLGEETRNTEEKLKPDIKNDGIHSPAGTFEESVEKHDTCSPENERTQSVIENTDEEMLTSEEHWFLAQKVRASYGDWDSEEEKYGTESKSSNEREIGLQEHLEEEQNTEYNKNLITNSENHDLVAIHRQRNKDNVVVEVQAINISDEGGIEDRKMEGKHLGGIDRLTSTEEMHPEKQIDEEEVHVLEAQIPKQREIYLADDTEKEITEGEHPEDSRMLERHISAVAKVKSSPARQLKEENVAEYMTSIQDGKKENIEISPKNEVLRNPQSSVLAENLAKFNITKEVVREIAQCSANEKIVEGKFIIKKEMENFPYSAPDNIAKIAVKKVVSPEFSVAQNTAKTIVMEEVCEGKEVEGSKSSCRLKQDSSTTITQNAKMRSFRDQTQPGHNAEIIMDEFCTVTANINVAHRHSGSSFKIQNCTNWFFTEVTPGMESMFTALNPQQTHENPNVRALSQRPRDIEAQHHDLSFESFQKRVREVEERHEKAQRQFEQNFIEEFMQAEKKRIKSKQNLRKQWLLTFVQSCMLLAGLAFVFHYEDNSPPPT
eukprot:Gb_25946 [translate_table: standard]